MAKLIVIDCCCGCSFMEWNHLKAWPHCYHEEAYDDTKQHGKRIPKYGKIPKWCPLPDAPKEVKK